MDAAKLTRVYLKMRQARSDLKREYEARDAEIKENMATVEGLMMGTLAAVGVKSMSSGAGTFFKQNVTHFNCIDWPAYHAWMAENEAFEGVEKRVGKVFLANHLSETKALPPGITSFDETVVRVRVGNE